MIPLLDIFFVFKDSLSCDVNYIQHLFRSNEIQPSAHKAVLITDLEFSEISGTSVYPLILKVHPHISVKFFDIGNVDYLKAASIVNRYYSQYLAKSLLSSLFRVNANELFIYLALPSILLRLFVAQAVKSFPSLVPRLHCADPRYLFSLDRSHLNANINFISRYSLLPLRYSPRKRNILAKIVFLCIWPVILNSFFHLARAILRLSKFIKLAYGSNRGGKPVSSNVDNLVVITGNAECDSLRFTLSSGSRNIYLFMPLASSDIANSNFTAFLPHRPNIFIQLILYGFTFSFVLPVTVLYLAIVSLIQLLSIPFGSTSLYWSYFFYCLKSAPYSLNTLALVLYSIIKYKPASCLSANNIDSNLSLITTASRAFGIPHSVYQCTSLEWIPLPNYCDCDAYYCESQEYSLYLSSNIDRRRNRVSILYPVPQISAFVRDYFAYKQKLSDSVPPCTSSSSSPKTTIVIGIPTQAEFINILPIVDSILRTSLDQAIPLQLHVSVRLHPRESPGAYSAILSRYEAYSEFLTIDNNVPLAQWLASCNMIIGSSSTVLYWACMVSMPTLSLLFRKNQYLAGLLPHLSSSHVYTSNTHLDQLVLDFILLQAQNNGQKFYLDIS